MTAHDLADSLEGHKEGAEWRCRCPIHGGRSLYVREKDGRVLLVCRAGCNQSEVILELRKSGLWGAEAEPTSPPIKSLQDDTAKKADRADTIWHEAQTIKSGDPVHQYLTGRGIILEAFSSDLRCHMSLPYWTQDDDGNPRIEGIFPAMIAVIKNTTGRPVGLHRTYLTTEGRKAPVTSPKKIMKVSEITGSAIRLFTPVDGFIAVSEGIEDALSAWILWQVPTWACIGTSGMRSFEPPTGTTEVLILADNDEPGRKAAFELSDRMEAKGMAVRIASPTGHKDVNAMLQERR